MSSKKSFLAFPREGKLQRTNFTGKDLPRETSEGSGSWGGPNTSLRFSEKKKRRILEHTKKENQALLWNEGEREKGGGVFPVASAGKGERKGREKVQVSDPRPKKRKKKGPDISSRSS